MPFIGIVYFITGLICLFMFGDGIESSVLLNIGDARYASDPNKSFWEAYICQISFMIVLMCHVPFVFFAGKEAMLTVIDEIQRKSVSNALWHKLQSNEHASLLESQEAPNPDLPVPGDATGTPYKEIVGRASEAHAS